LKRILVTGASGFIGRHVLPILSSAGWDVHAISSSKAVGHTANVSWHKCNLLDPVESQTVVSKIAASHCLHLAWYAEPGKFWHSPENFRWVRATLNILEAFHASGGKRIVAAGTCAEYDWRYGYCNEEVTPLAPATPYGKCKDATRRLMESFGTEYGLQVAWGRVFYLYGPYEPRGRLFSSIAESLLSGQEARCTHGNQVRDFLHVEDVAAAFVCLVSSEAIGAYNIGSSQPVRIRDVVEILSREIGRADLLRLGAVPARFDEPPLIVADNRRLYALGWQQRLSLSDGIAQTANWWKTIAK
jgi:nucleoside-diphosphate-sugar epimerase